MTLSWACRTATIPRLEERARPSPVVRNVRYGLHRLLACTADDFPVLTERVAIARALIRNPKILLLDE